MAIRAMFDELWYDKQADFPAYAAKLKAANVNNLQALALGFWKGGTIGYQVPSTGWLQASSPVVPVTAFQALIDAMAVEGISVTAVFNTTWWESTKNPQNGFAALFPAHMTGSKFVDIHNTAWQTWISDVAGETITALPALHGIMFDFVRTEHYDVNGNDLDQAGRDANVASMHATMQACYNKVKAANPNASVESWTGS